MKPLDKLEKEMFKAQQGFDYEDGVDVFSKEEIREMEDAARAAAKVAVDLAKRALDKGESIGSNSESFNWTESDCEIERKAFWKKEGIEP